MPTSMKESCIFRKFRIFKGLIPGLALALLCACTGMSGSPAAPGAFADTASTKDGGGTENNPGAEEAGPTGNTLGDYRPGSDGVPTGLTKIEGPPNTGAGAGVTTPGVTTEYTIAGSNPFGGYRPGNEGQVQMGHNVGISVSALNGSNNCNKASDSPWEVLFPEGPGPTVYWWLSQEENGPYIPTGFHKLANEYGRTQFSCIDHSDGKFDYYKHALILVSYTDAQGKVHRSENLSITCPDIRKGEAAEFCIDLKSPLTPLKIHNLPAEVLLQNRPPPIFLRHAIPPLDSGE